MGSRAGKWHCLNLRPLPHQQGAFRPSFGTRQVCVGGATLIPSPLARPFAPPIGIARATDPIERVLLVIERDPPDGQET